MKLHRSFSTILLRSFCLVVLPLSITSGALYAQETVFNVPSADVLDAGKTYFEWDAVVGDAAPSAAMTPRMVRGIGHNVEAGFNVSSLNAPEAGTVTFVSTLKWKFYETKSHTLCFFAGNDVYTPIRHRTYNLGDSSYVEAAKVFKTGTRVGVGAYDFTSGVIDHANRGGAVASVEQTVSPKLGVAVDWYSGNNSVGYVTPGVSYKIGSQLTAFAAYQMGNHGLSQGNHSLLLILGWNPTWGQTRQ